MPAVLQRFREARGGGEEQQAVAQDTQLTALLEAQPQASPAVLGPARDSQSEARCTLGACPTAPLCQPRLNPRGLLAQAQRGGAEGDAGSR